jgi:hypothetical protein
LLKQVGHVVTTGLLTVKNVEAVIEQARQSYYALCTFPDLFKYTQAYFSCLNRINKSNIPFYYVYAHENKLKTQNRFIRKILKFIFIYITAIFPWIFRESLSTVVDDSLFTNHPVNRGN